jgi:hypothetical protein
MLGRRKCVRPSSFIPFVCGKARGHIQKFIEVTETIFNPFTHNGAAVFPESVRGKHLKQATIFFPIPDKPEIFPSSRKYGVSTTEYLRI